MLIGRRNFLTLGAGAALVVGGGTTGCAKRQTTPNAHLYGHEWVSATYEMYGQKYAGVQAGSEANANKTYAALARRGVVSLDALQARDVPFFIRADEIGSGFAVDRKVPERLTFTSDMSAADRAAAQAKWEKAQAHVHTDYEEIRKLNGALTSLMGEIHSVRAAIELGRREQFQIVRQIGVLREGTTPPFELPYRVSTKNYEEILLLLLERLDDDCERLQKIEAAMVTVGLTARSTDAGSGSMSPNLYKVLLSISEDAASSAPRPTAYPNESALHDALLDRGKSMYATILKSPAYQQFEREERARAFESIGAVLSAFDSLGIVPLKASAIFQQVLGFYRGDGDYLGYLKTALGLLPFGGSLTKSLNSAVATTEEARRITKTVSGASPEALLKSSDRLLKAANGKALLNAGTEYGLARMGRQLAFFKSRNELMDVTSALGGTDLLPKDEAEATIAKLHALADR
jgi:hypothetical protein